MKVSVIIPFGGSRVLQQVLDSLKRQSFDKRGYEVIVVGRGPYNQIDIDDQVKFIETEKENSPARNRNIGIDEACGEIILFLDADCIPKNDWIEKMVSSFKKGKKVIGGAIDFPCKDIIALSDNISWFNSSFPTVRSGKTSGICLPTANLGILRDLIIELGKFDETLPCGEDIDLSIKLKKKSIELYFENEACVYHHHSRNKIRDLISHGKSWGKDSIIMRKIYKNELNTPKFLLNKYLLLASSPLISFFVTLKIFLKTGGLRKYFYTFPLVYLSKLSWCYSAFKELD